MEFSPKPKKETITRFIDTLEEEVDINYGYTNFSWRFFDCPACVEDHAHMSR